MYNKKWFKVLVWSMSSLFFFQAACLLIGLLGPSPNETQLHLWMSGMMKAMEISLMGQSMTLEEGGPLANLMYKSCQLILPAALGGFIIGLILRIRGINGYKNK